MKFETSVIYQDCIFIFAVAMQGSELHVNLVKEIGDRQFEIPTSLQLRIAGERVEHPSVANAFLDKLITAINHHIRGPRGGFKKSI